MPDHANIITINNPEIIRRHFENLAYQKPHCIITTDSKVKVSGIYIQSPSERDEIAIDPYPNQKIKIKKGAEVNLEYEPDGILHSCLTRFLRQEENLLIFEIPVEIKRYQMRRFKRIDVPKDKIVKILFSFLSGKQMESPVSDLGEGGMAINLEEPPEKMKRNIRLNSIKLMLKENETLHVSGILRYIQKNKKNADSYRIGIEFDPLKENDRATLLDFIDDLSEKKNKKGDD